MDFDLIRSITCSGNIENRYTIHDSYATGGTCSVRLTQAWLALLQDGRNYCTSLTLGSLANYRGKLRFLLHSKVFMFPILHALTLNLSLGLSCWSPCNCVVVTAVVVLIVTFMLYMIKLSITTNSIVWFILFHWVHHKHDMTMYNKHWTLNSIHWLKLISTDIYNHASINKLPLRDISWPHDHEIMSPLDSSCSLSTAANPTLSLSKPMHVWLTSYHHILSF